jgi:hypothetical protein
VHRGNGAMQVALDLYDRATVYADLRDEECLTDDLRARAVARARQLGAEHVEFWRSPYGRGGDRMAGFVELAAVPAVPEPAPGELSSTV